MSLPEIAALKLEIEGGRNPKDAKVLLAKEITARFHSAAAAEAAHDDFQRRAAGGAPDEMPEVTLAGAAEEMVAQGIRPPAIIVIGPVVDVGAGLG